MSENEIFDQLHQLMAQVSSPASRRRRHLRRRLAAVPDELLQGAVSECFQAIMLDADERFFLPFTLLVEELNRRQGWNPADEASTDPSGPSEGGPEAF